MAKVLIVDDEDNIRKILAIQLKRLGHEVLEAPDGPEALEILSDESVQTIVTDLKMPKMDGLELLQRVRKAYPQIPTVMITAHGTVDTAVEAMKRGAFDYITKPFDHEEFLKVIDRAVRSAEEMSKEFQRSRSFLKQEDKIIGTTQDMEKVYSLIEKVANNSSNVLITGEAGTGKEVVVRLLHDRSSRAEKPLVRAYLGSVPTAGHKEHLFGSPEKPGAIELAEEGSLYLDEVSALDMETQAELFEVLTSGKWKINGEEKQINCRVIAASDFNLLKQIDEGKFRKDLFYCLNVVPIYLPPLRERTQDIEPLADHFISVFSKKFSKKVSHVDEDALFRMISYSWPGNIRELENCMEYAVNVTETPVISESELPPHLLSEPPSGLQPELFNHRRDALIAKVQGLERDAILEALKSSSGDLLRASQKLGVPPSLLEEKAGQLKISDFH